MDAVPPAMPEELRSHQAMVQNSRRWMEASDVIPMFPTFVWKVQIEAGLHDEPRARFLAAMTEMRARLPPLAPGTRPWLAVGANAAPARGDM